MTSRPEGWLFAGCQERVGCVDRDVYTQIPNPSQHTWENRGSERPSKVTIFGTFPSAPKILAELNKWATFHFASGDLAGPIFSAPEPALLKLVPLVIQGFIEKLSLKPRTMEIVLTSRGQHWSKAMSQFKLSP